MRNLIKKGSNSSAKKGYVIIFMYLPLLIFSYPPSCFFFQFEISIYLYKRKVKCHEFFVTSSWTKTNN
jgi:hypothetical protein